MKEEISNLANGIYKYLSENGETDTLKLKLQIKKKNSIIFLALGWLVKDGKIYLRGEGERTYAGVNPKKEIQVVDQKSKALIQ